MSLTGDFLTLTVADIAAEAKDAIVVDLKDPQGRALPAFTPGAHIELHLSNGMIRQYSLCNDSRERNRYRIGVGFARESRGGSQLLHRGIRVGDTLQVTVPRNNFPLTESASTHHFIAGGIGITPILAMIRWCEANGKDWHLTYLVRNRQRAAFYEELQNFGGRVTLHADDEQNGLFDVAAAVARIPAESHIYCCGPSPLMHTVEALTADRPPERVHFEWFVPKALEGAAEPGSFTVRLARSGMTLTVPPDKTILDVLEDNGIDAPFSCREGLCATCETNVLSGVPDHRDSVLTTSEKAGNKVMMICISRSLSDTLELDL